jgi:hypothetical protein
MIGNYVAKVLWEVLATPVTYKIVGYLKRVEQEDFYDIDPARRKPQLRKNEYHHGAREEHEGRKDFFKDSTTLSVIRSSWPSRSSW